MAEPRSLSVEAARAAILAKVPTARTAERIALSCALGRTLASDLYAKVTLPPTAVSAMDGYAVRTVDLVDPCVKLEIIGESAAGHAFPGQLGPGECVRIFTGAPVPEGADAIVVQEMARVEDRLMNPAGRVTPGNFIRSKGMDFETGSCLLSAGTRLGPVEIAVAAAMDHSEVPVVRCPRVAILASGDELAPPGEARPSGKIASSNSFAIAGLVRTAGGEPIDLGIAGDRVSALEGGIERAQAAAADVLVTVGGASVGDHDLVKTALTRKGMELDFWRIAMRPGRPLIHGRLGTMPILGLPGNPVSAIVAGIVFLIPLLRALCGDPKAHSLATEPAVLGSMLHANDGRKDFLRARLATSECGLPVATPFEQQDSSLLSVLSRADCLLVREPDAPPAEVGDPCRIIRLFHHG